MKTTVAVEETIGHHVLGLLDRAGKGQPSSKIVAWESKTEESIKSSVCVGYEKGTGSVFTCMLYARPIICKYLLLLKLQ